MKKFLWIVCVSLLVLMLFSLIACNKKKEEGGHYSYTNGEYTNQLDLHNGEFELTNTHQNGYQKEVVVSRGTYTYYNNIYALTRETETVSEYYFDFNTPINTYENDVSYLDRVYVQEIGDNILIVDGTYAVSKNGEASSNLSPLALYSKNKTYTSQDAIVAKGASNETLAKTLKLGIVYQDLFCQDAILTASNITSFDSLKEGIVTATVSYKGLTYNATVKVVEEGLEKTLDASELTSIVRRGYSLSEYISYNVSNNKSLKYDGNNITLTASMVTGWETGNEDIISITITYNNVETKKTIKVYNPDNTNSYQRIYSVKLKDTNSIFFPKATTAKNLSNYIDSFVLLKADGTLVEQSYSSTLVNWTVTGLNDTTAGANYLNITFTKDGIEYKYTQPLFFYSNGEIYYDAVVTYLGDNACAYVKNNALELTSGTEKITYTILRIGKTTSATKLKLEDINHFDVDRVSSEETDFIIPVETYEYGGYTFYIHFKVKKA